MASVVQCREPGCGAQIQFVRNSRGRAVPVAAGDAEPFYFFPDQPGHPQVVVVTEGGEVIRGRQGSRHDSGVTRVMGWESHLSSCPGVGRARSAD